MQRQAKFTFLSYKELFFRQEKKGLFVLIAATQSCCNCLQTLFYSNHNILLPENVYALNRQRVAKVEAGGTNGAVHHGFEIVSTSRKADNCKLFKTRFKSIIKHPD